MRVSVELNGQSLKFSYRLDPDDRRQGISFNAGRKPVHLHADHCSFHFPFPIDLPHPDACAFAGLKMLSPYIGSRLQMDRPISEGMAAAIRKGFPAIQTLNTSATLRPMAHPGGPVGLAFSGGSDSTAAAYLLPSDTKLIALVRQLHPQLGEIEPWHNGNEVGEVLDAMPARFHKIPVHTDFAYTSLDPTGTYAVWADRLWHSVPVVLLAEHFGLSAISHGNIMAAFLSNERIYREPIAVSKAHRIIFPPLGLQSIQPLAGASEYTSEAICRAHGHQGRTLTCNFGPWNQPCMACVKCLRKSLINHVLDGTRPRRAEIRQFNRARRVYDLSRRNPIPFTVTLKKMFGEIGIRFPGTVGQIQRRVTNAYPGNADWVTRLYLPFYENDPAVAAVLPRLLTYAEPMTDADIDGLQKLHIEPDTLPPEPVWPGRLARLRPWLRRWR